MAEKPDLTYVNSSNAKIYFGGILIDDIYDLQYAYRETKEPIYGYNSKYFDHLAGGNVIIHGSFTINYRHDKYLFHVLNKLGFTGSSVSSSTARMSRIKELNGKYLKILRDYRAAQKNDKELKNRVKQQEESEKAAKALAEYTKMQASRKIDISKEILKEKEDTYNAKYTSLTDEQKRIYNDYQSIEKNINRLQEEQLAIVKSYEQKLAEASQMNVGDDPDLVESKILSLQMKVSEEKDKYIQISEALVTGADSFFEDNPEIKDVAFSRIEYQESQLNLVYQEDDSKTVSSGADETVVNAEEDTKRVKQEFTDHQQKKKTLLEELEKVRKQLNDEQGSWSDLKELEATGKNVKRRPEDMPAFTIFININGMNHVVLEDVSIIGESLPIVVGGEAVKESYSFIARKIR